MASGDGEEGIGDFRSEILDLRFASAAGEVSSIVTWLPSGALMTVSWPERSLIRRIIPSRSTMNIMPRAMANGKGRRRSAERRARARRPASFGPAALGCVPVWGDER